MWFKGTDFAEAETSLTQKWLTRTLEIPTPVAPFINMD